MGMLFFPLVVIDQFNVKGVISFKTEDNAPVGAYRHRPQPFQIAFERVKAIPWNVESLWHGGGVENRKDPFDRIQQIRAYPAPVAALVEPFQAPVLEAPNHPCTL